MGYEKVHVSNEEELLANLKLQLQKHNQTTFSDSEFTQILNDIKKGVFDNKAILKQLLKRCVKYRFLCISKATIYNMLDRGELKAGINEKKAVKVLFKDFKHLIK